MIIFTLDALADDSHRRHFINAPEDDCYECWLTLISEIPNRPCEVCNRNPSMWSCDYPAYYNACDRDAPIQTMVRVATQLMWDNDFQIWSFQNESIRSKTLKWLSHHLFDCDACYRDWDWNPHLKLRPIGDDRPQEQLFEEWLRDNTNHISLNLETGKESWTNEIDMVFSSHKPTIAMFRARGVFVFDCNQGE